MVTPLKYLALLFAIIFGYFIWDEIPTIKTLFGALLVFIDYHFIVSRLIKSILLRRIKSWNVSLSVR